MDAQIYKLQTIGEAEVAVFRSVFVTIPRRDNYSNLAPTFLSWIYDPQATFFHNMIVLTHTHAQNYRADVEFRKQLSFSLWKWMSSFCGGNFHSLKRKAL